MAEFNNASQVAKLVNAKSGMTKVLVMKAAFNGADRSKGPLEASALHRLIIETHQVSGSGTNRKAVTLTGNIPSSVLPALLSLSEKALHDKVIYQQERSFSLLPGTWKPRVSTKDENGNVEVYIVEIAYNGAMALPVQFKLQTLRCPVATDNSGRMNVKLRETVDGSKNEITFYLSAEDWFNQLSNAVDVYKLYRSRKASLGAYDEAFGLKTE